MGDSFSDILKILSSFFMGFIWEIFGKVSVHVLVFTLVPRFVIAVGSGRGDGAANFAELDSDFSEPGKHV